MMNNNLTLKFTDDAYVLYESWFKDNERLLRSDALTPALESHFAKYRGLVPSLAAIFYVLNNEWFEIEPLIDKKTMESAISYVEYLRSHAERIYALPEHVSLKGAKVLLDLFDQLPNPFTSRHIYKGKFPGLKTAALAEAAIAVLEDHGYCKPENKTNAGRGRPSNSFVKHPKYLLPKLPKNQLTPPQPLKNCSGE